MSNELPPSQSSPPPPTPPLPGIPPDEANRRSWNMWCHLSALAGFVVPFGNLLGPLLIWQIKKHELPGIEAHGKAAMNFQISMLIYTLVGTAVTVISAFFCLGFLMIPLLVLLVAAITIGSAICSVIAGMKANDGKEYAYPLTLRLL